jgi:hypothetical protein
VGKSVGIPIDFRRATLELSGRIHPFAVQPIDEILNPRVTGCNLFWVCHEPFIASHLRIANLMNWRRLMKQLKSYELKLRRLDVSPH